ncbi:MAG: ABC transporter ATP-binding protein [Solirubrobacteraceae bacterium]|jgi:ABC-2 type transport system ATP-binding protein
MSAIEVRELRKSYGEVEAVRGVGFSVEPGEVFCLLGPNGAGKTTITEILEGYRTRDGGEVSVLGLDPGGRHRELRERVGIVLQSCGVQTGLTVAELIDMYGRYHLRRRSVEELIEIVELDAKRETLARELSGGQRRRLDLALALVGEPDLIFLDEPTTGFDPQARRQAWTTIRSLCELGKTIFLTTHFMDEAQTLGHRVAVMRAGVIVAEGRPDELGGRELRPTVIRFTLPDGHSAGELPDLPADEVDGAGERVAVRTHDAVRATAAITTWALERQIELASFSVTQPTLEDVYLELTGEQDAAASGALQ